MAKIRFRDSENKVVFDYPKAEALSDCAERMVCLSQRDYYLLLNSIQFIGQFRNRVYTSRQAELYEICSDEQWTTFQSWVEDLENNLGAWPMCQEALQDLVKTNRMIVAALMGQSINFDSEPLPNAINYSPGIIGMLNGIKASVGNDMTLAELITAMEGVDNETYGFKDYLEILKLLQELFPDIGGMGMGGVGQLWKSISQARITHNQLSLMAIQATHLRGIQNAISPTQDEDTEQAKVQSIAETIDSTSWLTSAIFALVDPSPAGEATMVIKLGLAAKNVVTGLLNWLPNWWNQYINTVGDPQPQGTVVGMLSEISRKFQSLQDETDFPGVTLSNRGKLIADALTAIELQGKDLEPVLTAIAQQLGSDYEPEGGE